MRTKLNLKGTITVGVPAAAAVVLGLILGAAEVVNEVVLEASSQWHSYILVLLVFGGGVGISPIVGPAFRAALHLPSWAGYVVSAGMAAAVLALSTVDMSNLLHAVVGAALTVLAALGFAPASPVAVGAVTSEARRR
jgi:hypothetical protein